MSEIVNFTEVAAKHPTLREPIIHGLLRRGEVANIVAPPKCGASWLALQLSLSVANGASWLGFETTKSRVLHIDTELDPAALCKRFEEIVCAAPLSRAGVELLPLRGRTTTLEALAEERSNHDGGSSHCGLVVIKPASEIIRRDIDEYSNDSVSRIYRLIGRFAEKMNAAVVLIHRAMKPTSKHAEEMSVGADAISRAADTHITTSRDNESFSGEHRFTFATRTFQTPQPLRATFDFPLWKRI